MRINESVVLENWGAGKTERADDCLIPGEFIWFFFQLKHGLVFVPNTLRIVFSSTSVSLIWFNIHWSKTAFYKLLHELQETTGKVQW